ncbi:hypothetical protein RM697_03830 [Ichthyenterobacterium sp. W332]|uniref:Lipoprotein n=1 Tax=Microcosmobacter mediterraneus TaxID=3075607 RepID=A0ABU2YIZ8_9FLAO|nr:hypothetical protein [Ichthyenterobacterium sp. W332]MDT0557760.1 hypothetical protein [Ichthyenterobacterium sp. W332]
MRTLKYVLLFLLIMPSFLACEEDEEGDNEPERLTVLATFNNDRGIGGCNPSYAVTFVVSYRDIQAFIDLPPQGTGFLNLLVEDGESINVQVRKQTDDSVVADANVSVRTDSRPEALQESPRIVSFCEVFNLSFQNF